MDAIAKHRDWIVWQHSISLATALHATACTDASSSSALREQMKESSVALATHIAESVAVANRSERVRVLCSARSLLARIEVQLQICQRMRVADDLISVNEQISLLCRLIDDVIRRLREQPNRDARSATAANTRRSIAVPAPAAAILS
jgi:four helix bundle protein